MILFTLKTTERGTHCVCQWFCLTNAGGQLLMSLYQLHHQLIEFYERQCHQCVHNLSPQFLLRGITHQIMGEDQLTH